MTSFSPLVAGLVALLPAAVCVAGFLAWTLRLRRAMTLVSGSRPDAPPAASSQPTRVSIVVPARNEAHNLPALLASLRALAPAAHQIIIVDDHSTDGTGDLARAAGATVVTPPPLPPGWLGKPWACHAGAQAATGDLLLFSDADTVHAPWSLARAVARLDATGADLLSVIPTHAVVALWEKLQGVFQLLLLVACRAGGEGARGERRFSIGQYLLFRRSAYQAVGGHPAVKDRVAEDLAFARMVEHAGLRFDLLYAPGLMTVRMYPEGLGGFWRGWRRNFREGIASAGIGGGLEMIAVVGWLLGLPLFATQAVLAGAPLLAVAWLGAMVVTAAEIARRQRGLGALPAWGALLFPLPVLLFVAISIAAVIDKARRAPVRWRGRSVVTSAVVGAFLAVAPAPALAEPPAAKPAPTKPAPAKPAPTITIVALTAQPAIVRRIQARPAELEGRLRSAILAMLAEATAGGLDLAGPPFVRYHARGELWDVEAGLPVVKAPPATPGAATQPATLPAGDAATLVHVGPYPQLPAAHEALARWAAASKRTAAGAGWEVYLTNPITTPDPARARTKLFLPLAPVQGPAK
jgi:4,4'-diaponeurosporenoate glycosyltransferase